MVNRGWINKHQFYVFVECLRVVLAYKSFYKNKPGSKKQKFQNLCGLKSTNLKALKVEILFRYV